MKMGYKQRQLALCRCVLSHGSFADTLKAYFETGVMPEKKEIVQIMKKTEVYNVKSDVTFWRRSSTIRGWVNWIVGLINE